MEDITTLFLVLFLVVIFSLYIYSIIWAYKDADRRGKPALLVALMVAILSWPGSLLLWLVFRPEIKKNVLP